MTGVVQFKIWREKTWNIHVILSICIRQHILTFLDMQKEIILYSNLIPLLTCTVIIASRKNSWNPCSRRTIVVMHLWLNPLCSWGRSGWVSSCWCGQWHRVGIAPDLGTEMWLLQGFPLNRGMPYVHNSQDWQYGEKTWRTILYTFFILAFIPRDPTELQ